MQIVQIVGLIGLNIILGLILLWRRPAEALSDFELKRQAQAGVSMAKRRLDRRRYRQVTDWLRQLIGLMLAVASTGLYVSLLGAWGVGLAALNLLVLNIISNKQFLARQAWKIYQLFEAKLYEFLGAKVGLVQLIGLRVHEPALMKLTSVDEMTAGLKVSSNFPPQLRQQLLSRCQFDDRVAADIMTPASTFAQIKAGELLGPLVLDDLHRSDEQYVLVQDEAAEQVIGWLDLTTVVSVSAATDSVTAAEAMSRRLYVVSAEASLSEVLNLQLASHVDFVLVEDDSTIVGGIKLAQLVAALGFTSAQVDADKYASAGSKLARKDNL